MPLPLPPRELPCGPWTLRAVGDDDWQVVQRLSRCPEVVRWTNHPADMSELEARARVARQQERARQGATQRYVIRDGDVALGTCGLGRLDQAVPEAMYALLPQARGRGVATLVLVTLRDWAAGHGRPGVSVVTVDGNDASAAVARRAGFAIAETFDDYHRGAPATLHRWRWSATS